MMTSRKSRLSPALEDGSVDSLTAKNPKMNLTNINKDDLIELNDSRLKESIANEFIKENDANDEWQLGNNQQKENVGSQQVQRILNKEMAKNVEEMQPLMTMDKELCPMSSDAESDVEQHDTEAQDIKALLKPNNLIYARKHHLLAKQYEDNKSDKLMQTVLTTNGYIKKFTYYDTWHFIRPRNWPSETCPQRQCLDFPLVKLANASTSMKLPSGKWSSKVTLYKVLPAVLKRHTLTIFSGDLKMHKIPEKDRQKYQPSCVIFRRVDATQHSSHSHSKCHVTYDRIIIFKNKHISISFEGKHVQLNGAPDAVTCLQDVSKLLDIIDSISLSNPMIEIINTK